MVLGKGVAVQRAYPKVTDLNPQRWSQVKELFEQALELDDHRRADFLDEIGRTDESLAREVGLLISGHHQAGSFIETPPHEVAADVLTGGQTRLAEGDQISKYRIISHIDGGGSGEVYLAEDGQLKRKVAIKILRQMSLEEGQTNKRVIREARAAAATGRSARRRSTTRSGSTETTKQPSSAKSIARTTASCPPGPAASTTRSLSSSPSTSTALAAASEGTCDEYAGRARQHRTPRRRDDRR